MTEETAISPWEILAASVTALVGIGALLYPYSGSFLTIALGVGVVAVVSAAIACVIGWVDSKGWVVGAIADDE